MSKKMSLNVAFADNARANALDRPKSSVTLSGSSQELHAPRSPVSLLSSAASASDLASSDNGRESMRRSGIRNVHFKGKKTVLEEQQKKTYSETKKNYEVDHVGNGTFQPSQLCLLNPRSNNLFPSGQDAVLSARGLHHRSKEVFAKEVKAATSTISQLMMEHSKTEKGRALLFTPIFQRAVGKERLGDLTGAIQDYAKCLSIAASVTESSGPAQATLAAVHANRAGLYKSQGKRPAAMEDIQKAIKLDPHNLKYRETLCLLHREMGQYSHAAEQLLAAHEAFVSSEARTAGRRAKAAQGSSGIGSIDWKQLSGSSKDLDSQLNAVLNGSKDPLMAALAKPPGESRSDVDVMHIVDFMKTTKLFASVSGHDRMLRKVASMIVLQSFTAGNTVFEEGDRGEHFFIILDGEISIVKKKAGSSSMAEADEKIVLVKLFRGNSFGEAALENSGGRRTAGALASKPTRLLCMGALDYQIMLKETKAKQKEQVRRALTTSPLFASWEAGKIDMLAGCALVRNYNPSTEVLAVGESSKYLMMIVTGLVNLLKPIARPTPSSSQAGRGSKGTTSGPPVALSSYNVDTLEEKEDEDVMSDLDTEGEGDGEQEDKRLASSSERILLPSVRQRPTSSYGVTQPATAVVSRPHTAAPVRPATGAGTVKIPPTPQSRKELDESIRKLHRKMIRKERKVEQVPGMWVLEKSWNESVLEDKILSQVKAKECSAEKKSDFVVAVLGSGQVFGEWSILNPRAVSEVAAVAYTALEVYCFEIDVLTALGIRFKTDTMHLLQESFRLLNAPPEKISYYFNMKVGWEEKKKVLMETLKLKLKNSHAD